MEVIISHFRFLFWDWSYWKRDAVRSCRFVRWQDWIETTYIKDNLESNFDCEWEDDGGNIFAVFNIDDKEWLY